MGCNCSCVRLWYGTVTTWQEGQTATCSHEPLRFLSSSSVTLVIRYKSLLKEVREGYVNSSVWRTRSSLRVMTTPSPYEGVRRRDWQWQGEGVYACVCKRKGWQGWCRGNTEENKQLFRVSRQLSAVQFLPLSSTGNNYREGWATGQPALPLLIHCKHPLKEQQPSNSPYQHMGSTQNQIHLIFLNGLIESYYFIVLIGVIVVL